MRAMSMAVSPVPYVVFAFLVGAAVVLFASLVRFGDAPPFRRPRWMLPIAVALVGLGALLLTVAYAGRWSLVSGVGILMVSLVVVWVIEAIALTLLAVGVTGRRSLRRESAGELGLMLGTVGAVMVAFMYFVLVRLYVL